MGRKHTPKGQVVLKKAEKLQSVDAALPSGASAEDFVAKFQEMFPDDWGRIVRRYEAHERQTAPGKGHPMPEPRKYLLNMVKNFLRTRTVSRIEVGRREPQS